MRANHVLAADVGGTKTAVVLGAAGARWPGIVEEKVYPSQDYPTFEDVIAEFLALPKAREHASRIAAACVCVAGPVEEERATTTNLRWTIDAHHLGERFGIRTVRLFNDFVAAAVGVGRLDPGDMETLQAGRDVVHGARAVVGAGTGLGVALMTWSGGSYTAHASEAGHADFAPVDEVQDGLLQYLRRQYERVSYERVLSGAGLSNIFRYLAGRKQPTQAMLEALDRERDDAAVVSRFGLERQDPVAVQALDVFAAIYGAFAGNIALTVLARGGVYIAGGIAPKIAAKLKDGALVGAFTDKGRFSSLLRSFPLHVVMNSRVGLYGALDLARGLAGGAQRPARVSHLR
ncbi:MAG TPA: glucokinase [Burkholderiales bacterium]|nr:glucokinase [Burkholderiales bacterium]